VCAARLRETVGRSPHCVFMERRPSTAGVLTARLTPGRSRSLQSELIFTQDEVASMQSVRSLSHWQDSAPREEGPASREAECGGGLLHS
jgi:hypothetical protein